MSAIEGFHCIQDASPGPQGVRNRGVPLLYRMLYQVPKVSAIEGFHCIQDASPGPQGVRNGGDAYCCDVATVFPVHPLQV